jgi:hypothetical protein
MRFRLGSTLVAVMLIGTGSQISLAQQKAGPPPPKKSPLLKLAEAWPEEHVLQARSKEADSRRLFKEHDPLAFTLTADFKAINKDRDPESTKRFPGVLTVAGEKGAPRDLAVQLGTRGHFRLMSRNCDFVPLRLELPKEGTTGTAFEAQTSLKLGTHCRGDRAYENYTIREYLTYRLFNMVTPLSFRAASRPAPPTSTRRRRSRSATRYSIFIEHENEVARRHGGRIVELPRIVFKDLDAPTLTRMMMFEYMIGNTDFSIWALHNVRIVQDPARRLYPVPYDFDLSGFVHAPYATPDPRHRHPQRPGSALPRAVPHRPTSSKRWRRAFAPSATTCCRCSTRCATSTRTRSPRRRSTWRASSGRLRSRRDQEAVRRRLQARAYDVELVSVEVRGQRVRTAELA